MNRLLIKYDQVVARHVTSMNTHYANTKDTKFLCDLFTVYSDEKVKPPKSAYAAYFET